VRSAPPEPPALVTSLPLEGQLRPVAGKPGTFLAKAVARTPSGSTAMDVEFRPFYGVHRRTYAAYWDVLTTAEFDAKVAEIYAEKKRRLALETATIASIATVEPAAEKPFNLQGEESTIVRTDGRPGRRSAKWFSYDLPVDGSISVSVVVTYNSDNRRARNFSILIDGVAVKDEAHPQSSVSKFYDARYAVPAAAGKKTISALPLGASSTFVRMAPQASRPAPTFLESAAAPASAAGLASVPLRPMNSLRSPVQSV